MGNNERDFRDRKTVITDMVLAEEYGVPLKCQTDQFLQYNILPEEYDEMHDAIVEADTMGRTTLSTYEKLVIAKEVGISLSEDEQAILQDENIIELKERLLTEDNRSLIKNTCSKLVDVVVDEISSSRKYDFTYLQVVLNGARNVLDQLDSVKDNAVKVFQKAENN